MSEATNRAEMPKGSQAVLDRRTVFNANRNLLDIIVAGNHVLDVGCGSGSITAGMHELVGSQGSAIGIDPSEHLIGLAVENYSGIENLHFEVADINSYTPGRKFDVVSAARVLQWLANPEEVLAKMTVLTAENGFVTILDYNHTKIEWTPAIPESMQIFYQAFLKWRADAGMDNEIADNLHNMFEKLELKNIIVNDFSEHANASNPDFEGDISIWKKVAETRGKQLVAENYINESQRLLAIEEYDQWIKSEATSMKMYLLAVTGQK